MRSWVRGAAGGLARELKITWLTLFNNALTNIVSPAAFACAAFWVESRLVTAARGEASSLGVLKALVWSFLALYCVDLPNQMKGIEEDRRNKPWRPLPRGLMTPRGARLRWSAALVCFFAASACWSVLWHAVAWQALMMVYVFTPLLHRHWLTKNLVFLSAAFVILLATAWTLVAPLPPQAWRWLVAESMICSLVYLIQDFRDGSGDIESRRVTLPLQFGEAAARRVTGSLVAVVVPVLCFWFLLDAIALSPAIKLAWTVLNTAVCATMGARLVWRTSRRDDFVTYTIVEAHFVLLSLSCGLLGLSRA
jgi:4-hydroxybenzoate polyprenyltransferase